MPIPPVSSSSLFAPLQPTGGGLKGLFGGAQPAALRLALGPAPLDEATDVASDPLELYRSLAALGASVQTSLIGTGAGGGLASFFAPAPSAGDPAGSIASFFGNGTPPPGASSASADILGAFFQPQFDLLGDVINALG